MVQLQDVTHKIKVVQNEILSNFAFFIGDFNLAHHLGARDDSTQISPSSFCDSVAYKAGFAPAKKCLGRISEI